MFVKADCMAVCDFGPHSVKTNDAKTPKLNKLQEAQFKGQTGETIPKFKTHFVTVNNFNFQLQSINN